MSDKCMQNNCTDREAMSRVADMIGYGSMSFALR